MRPRTPVRAWTGLLADRAALLREGRGRTGRTGRVEPVVAVAAWTGLDIFRPIAVAYAAVTVWGRREELVRPWVAVVVLAVLAAWSGFMIVHRRRTGRIIITEVALAAAAVLATRAADSMETIAAGGVTLPSVWPAGAVLGAAVLHGARGGIAAAAVIAVADIVEVGSPTQATIHNIVLLFLLGSLWGLAVDLARDGQKRLETALAEQERLRERERLARVVHDGVLQTLAFIHRQGQSLGGEAAELAELAAEQERSLRTFVTAKVTENRTAGDGVLGMVADPDGRRTPPDSTADLGAALSSLTSATVQVVTPGRPVLTDRHRIDELTAAVGAALDNVQRHAGDGARAWVLLEGTRERLRVTVRDTGTGCTPEDLVAAERAGRMGVARSIRGRAEDLGGTATWTTRPGAGCTVVIDVPTGTMSA